MSELPYLTSNLPGIGGDIKTRWDDFRVDEMPLYAASGEGTHLYFTIRKQGLPTPTAIDRIARHMHVKPTDIGMAGLKDAQAITTQRLSLEHADEQRLREFNDCQIEILDVSCHTNKLRPGHLAGNRFSIRIRGVNRSQLPAAQAVVDILKSRGVPNYFGHQRFGARGDTADLGRALIANDLQEFIELYLGRPMDDDPVDCKRARTAFDAGKMADARKAWPRHYANERKALAAYSKKLRPGPALGAIDKRMRRLYVSAFQSQLFNHILASRLDSIDKVMVGDMAEKCDSGGVFTVEDAAIEQPRAERFEISPTGPIVGYRVNLATGIPGEIEHAVIDASSVAAEDFRKIGSLKAKGGRRALRFAIDDCELSAGNDGSESFVELKFSAPSGCYATVVLREIMKNF